MDWLEQMNYTVRMCPVWISLLLQLWFFSTTEIIWDFLHSGRWHHLSTHWLHPPHSWSFPGLWQCLFFVGFSNRRSGYCWNSNLIHFSFHHFSQWWQFPKHYNCRTSSQLLPLDFAVHKCRQEHRNSSQDSWTWVHPSPLVKASKAPEVWNSQLEEKAGRPWPSVAKDLWWLMG